MLYFISHQSVSYQHHQVIHKSKFKAGVQSIFISLHTLGAHELLNLLDSKVGLAATALDTELCCLYFLVSL